MHHRFLRPNQPHRSDIGYAILWGSALVLFGWSGLHHTYAIIHPNALYPYHEVAWYACITLGETLLLRWAFRPQPPDQRVAKFSTLLVLLLYSIVYQLFTDHVTVIAYSHGMWSVLVLSIMILLVFLNVLRVCWRFFYR